ncbi:MAG: tetratricopeptide repeat protein [Geminocystis sp.]|nr:tetratricopeptide repeat protein [Geminocystis sp.]HIK38253.1 tetratricopeptide repeat protein [Geminocystis sp. M7585_C2015_104]MCS7146646.1 tetratricopeptide repeat protein [Geminocystis sp.]MCX8077205.1 tetratricopeptide repeat protein [Geminocystis sp.]MDW8115472.1 tetratricopeptide repeat protein [Geminocystis sp.]
MAPISPQDFTEKLESGKLAFERGRYGLSVNILEQACQLTPFYSKQGGEARLWLVNAYQAVGDLDKAIKLCEELTGHPHQHIKTQATTLLYILKAPRLKRRREWLTEIPDLTATAGNFNKHRLTNPGKIKTPPPQWEDLSKINTKDNNFLWLTLVVSVCLLTGFLLFS